ncbi:MAG: class I SAM-dependent methyltransferase [Alphaproteobacteria bacterium]|nr:class I SAM-dependent methyltransferase [Alphaproteobacteria bacterium]
MLDPFKDKAQDFDAQPMMLDRAAAIGGAVVDSVPLSPATRVLDFGAGTGLICEALAPHVGHIVAVDTSPSMLEKLAEKPAIAGKVSPLLRDITAEPLDERFDLIVSAMAMHHVQDTGGLLRTLAGHLVPGGRVALVDLDAEDGSFHPADMPGVFHAGFDREALGDLMRDAGFEDLSFSTVYRMQKNERDYPVFLVTGRLAG